MHGGFLGAVPSVYEPFAYPDGNLDGASDGGEIGLSGTWDSAVDGVHSTFVSKSSLAGSYASTGGSVGPLSPSVNKFGGARAVSGLAGSSLLSDGGTLWMSAVMGYAPGGNQTNARLTLALGNDQFNSGNFKYWIDDDVAQLGSAIGFTLGRIENTNGRAVATEFKDAASGDFISGNNLGSWTGDGTALGSNQHAFYVMKVEWGATPGDPETLTVYQPDANLNLGLPISVLTGFSVDQTTFDTLSFARGDVVVLDEIRMGADSTDVMPSETIPPSLVMVSPDQGQGVFPMQATFNEAIQVASGNIRIYQSNGSVLVTTIPVTDTAQVLLSGSTMTITPSATFTHGQDYYVELDQGLVQDLPGNNFAGLSGPERWSFTAGLPLAPGDLDLDGLNDNWELFYFGNLDSDGLADPDKDSLVNFLELEIGLNPTLADSNTDGIPDAQGLFGYLQVERWTGIAGESLEDLFLNPSFYGQSSEVYFVRQAKTVTDDGDEYGLKMSGRIIAPVTGAYQFWIAGNGECQLFLSDDATRFRKQAIASVPDSSKEEGWDEGASQKSTVIHLIAGQEYYLEVVMKEGSGPDHLAVAWEYPGQARQIISSRALKTHLNDPGDLDNDGMLDAWEVSRGLDSTDNGFTDLSQSSYLDPDKDGYRSFEEYLNGGNPLRVGGHRGSLAFDLWSSVKGNQIKDLTSSVEFAEGPDSTVLLAADVPDLKNGLPGGRLRGTVTPPETGYYVFDLSASFSGELWLGSDESRFTKKKIAWSKWPSSHQEWKGKGARHGKAQSEGVYLVAAKRYYLEALVKGGNHSNHLSVGWSRIPTTDWQTANVGPASAASWSEKDGVVTGSITGGAVKGTADEVTFRYLTLQGDFDLSVKVASFDSTTRFEEVGLMVRQSLDIASPHAFMLRRSNGSMVVDYRGVQGDRGRTVGGNGEESVYQWIRLKRVGDQFQGYMSMDGKSWGKRGRVTILMDEKVLVGIAINGAGSEAPTTATFDYFSFSAAEKIEVIPSSALTSIRPDLDDRDDDNLPDSWEKALGLDATTRIDGMGEYGDPDGDLLTNFEEYQLGTDPLKVESIPGYLSREVWTVGDLSIKELLSSPEVAGEPNERGYLDSAEYLDFNKHHIGQRVRGGLVAPVSGYYRFWISGDRVFELWLSKDSSKFNRRKLPSLEQEELDNSPTVKFRHFDGNPSQVSNLFFLEAGKEYFLEILHQDNLAQGHFSVAWSYTDQEIGEKADREIIPSSQLRSYVPDSNDLDDDYLPDDWEVANGLDPKDNGSSDPSQGGFGDLDGDGLTNAEEYQAGTRADLTDTDNDGVSDYDEVKLFGTNSLVGDVAPFQSVQTVLGSAYTASQGAWLKQGTAVRNSGVRGWVEYEISAPTAGLYLLDLAMGPHGGGLLSSDYEVIFSIGGTQVERVEVEVENGETGNARILSPWLQAGTHTVRIFNDNALTFRQVIFEDLEVLSAQGTDGNGDGTPDWVTLRLQEQNGIDRPTQKSKVSPVQIQGRVKFADLMTLPNGGGLNLSAGDRWYVDMDLSSGATTNFDVIFENGGLVESQSVLWTSTNLLVEAAITLRKGDSLLLTAHPEGEVPKGSDKVNLNLEGQSYSFEGNNPMEYQFNNAATHKVALIYQKGEGNSRSRQKKIITITVLEAPDVLSPVCVPGHFRPWDLPALPAGVELELDSRILVGGMTDLGDGATRYMIATDAPGMRYAHLRVAGGGAILSSIPIRSMTLRDSANTSVTFARDFADGSYQVNMPVVVSEMWPDVSVHHHIFLAGITFDTGEIDNDLFADDFDDLGQALITFIKTGTDGAACHRTSIYQGDVRIALFD